MQRWWPIPFPKSPQQASLISGNYIAGTSTTGLPARTNIPVIYDVADRVIISPQETAPLTVKVTQDIKDHQGNTVIPKGSSILGELQPQGGGTQFLARAVVIEGNSYPLDPASEIIPRTLNARDPNLLALARNAAFGAGAATGLSTVIGDQTITAERILVGAASGATIGGVIDPAEQEMIVIDSQTDLSLQLERPFRLSD